MPFEICPLKEEGQLQSLAKLFETNLSEPYSTFTLRYFTCQWPEYCLLANQVNQDKDAVCVGGIICKLDTHRKSKKLRGYIAMLVVDHSVRKMGLGTLLVSTAIERMKKNGAQEIVLETEADNTASLTLYERLGFVRDKRLYRYYLNGSDAFRLKLWLV